MIKISDYAYLPQKGSNAYQMSGLNEIESKISSVKIEGNRTNFLDKNGKVLLSANRSSESKRIDVFVFNNDNKYTQLVDKDQDGKYDMLYSVERPGRDTQLILSFNSTKDNDAYDDCSYNLNNETDNNGYMVYHKLNIRS